MQLVLLLSLLSVVSDSLLLKLSAQSTGCLISDSHKREPSPESGLYEACQSWSDLSCCRPNDYGFHLMNTTWLGFNYNHCGPISEACKNRFIKEICMYECDPYLSLWFVNDTSKSFRKQRLYQLPLCKRDCDAWFDDCRSSYTCRDNWSKGFKWSNKFNQCPPHEKCETFEQKFKNATNFCSKVWDESFAVSNDDMNCITFEFTNPYENPNKKAAKYYESVLNASDRLKTQTSYILVLLISSLLVLY